MKKVIWIRIWSDSHSFWSVDSGPERYKMKGKAEFNQQIFGFFFVENYIYYIFQKSSPLRFRYKFEIFFFLDFKNGLKSIR